MNFRLLILCVAGFFSVDAMSLSINSETIKSQLHAWQPVAPGVFQMIEESGVVHRYATGELGARADLALLEERLDLISRSEKSGSSSFVTQETRRLESHIKSLREFLKPEAKVKERSGHICGFNISWGLETTAINGEAFGYAYIEMHFAGNTSYPKTTYAESKAQWIHPLQYIAESQGSDFDQIPVGVFSNADAASGSTIPAGLQPWSLFAFATAYSAECEGVYDSLTSQYQYPDP